MVGPRTYRRKIR